MKHPTLECWCCHGNRGGGKLIIQPPRQTCSVQALLTREIIYMLRQAEEKLHGWETQAVAESDGVMGRLQVPGACWHSGARLALALTAMPCARS